MNHEPLPLGCPRGAPGGAFQPCTETPRAFWAALFVGSRPGAGAGAGERPRRAKSAWMRPPGTWQQPVAVQPQGVDVVSSSEMFFFLPQMSLRLSPVLCYLIWGFALWVQHPRQPLHSCAGAAQQSRQLWGGFLSGFTDSFIALVLPALPIQEKKRPFIILTPFLGAGAGQTALPVPHPLLTAQLP